MDDLPLIPPVETPTAERPLAGMTVMVVEDSRYASEAIRLLCLRSGARIRRADCLQSAHRHLQVYRPSVVIVDMGLPDGSGADLIRELQTASGELPVVLGLSGDPEAETAALAAGADGFMAKPVESVAVFQQAILSILPAEARPKGVRTVSSEAVDPDPQTLVEDLVKAADLLHKSHRSGSFDFLVHFLRGVALTAHDTELGEATEAFARAPEEGISMLERLIEDRLAATEAA